MGSWNGFDGEVAGSPSGEGRVRPGQAAVRGRGGIERVLLVVGPGVEDVVGRGHHEARHEGAASHAVAGHPAGGGGRRIPRRQQGLVVIEVPVARVDQARVARERVELVVDGAGGVAEEFAVELVAVDVVDPRVVPRVVDLVGEVDAVVVGDVQAGGVHHHQAGAGGVAGVGHRPGAGGGIQPVEGDLRARDHREAAAARPLAVLTEVAEVAVGGRRGRIGRSDQQDLAGVVDLDAAGVEQRQGVRDVEHPGLGRRQARAPEVLDAALRS